MFRESLKMSWKNIISNKMRSFLTTLGILIGVAAIISLVTLMEGVIEETNRNFEELGAGKIMVSVPGTEIKQGLSEKDIKDLSKIDNIESVTPNISVVMPIAANKEIVEDVSVEGKNGAYFKSNRGSIIRGRGLSILDVENKNNVCIISKDLEEKIFMGKNSINEKITISGVSYTIVGVIDTNGDGAIPAGLMGPESDGTVMIPYKQLMNITNTGYITSLDVTVKDTNRTGSAATSIEGYLSQKFNNNEDAYNVVNMDSILDIMGTMQTMMKNVLIGIASISLLVGGIGIMNMMLVNVSSRVTEIGLRKALGAQPKDIQIQFLLEAVILSMLGGIIGAILGTSIALVGFNLLNIAPVLSTGAITLGVGFSVLVGIIFGWSPAKKASELNPIDALRSV